MCESHVQRVAAVVVRRNQLKIHGGGGEVLLEKLGSSVV
jgi:hypothetical protein